MKVLVLGAGVVGTTAAFFLARDGHEVHVVDRREGAGLETSLANGGQVSASHARPWATPETPLKALKWMLQKDAPLVFRLFRWDPALWAWGLRFLRECTTARTAVNIERTVRLALYSREALKELRAAEDLRYDHRSLGILHIFREAREFEAHIRSANIMQDAGLPQTILKRSEIVQMEPALRHAAPKLVGGILSPGDESGDAHAFAREMARLAEESGADFHYEESIDRLEMDRSGRIAAIETDKGRRTADAYVLSLGSWSDMVARQAGLRLPIYPAKGYSVTLPLEPGTREAPYVSVTDDERKMVYSRLGNRLRAAGTAELAGWDPTIKRERAEQVKEHVRALFPLAGDYSKAEFWCGLRPKTPDSVPYIGRTPVPNLILNTGHGTLGWTMATGSARIVADLLGGREPDIDVHGLGLDRRS